MHYLTVEQLIKVNEAILTRCGGGLIGIVNHKALKEVIEKPKLKIEDYEPFPTLWEKAAVLIDTIIKNKPFANANTATAFIACDLMLKLNGYKLIININDIDQILAISLYQSTLPQISSWIKEKSIVID